MRSLQQQQFDGVTWTSIQFQFRTHTLASTLATIAER